MAVSTHSTLATFTTLTSIRMQSHLLQKHAWSIVLGLADLSMVEERHHLPQFVDRSHLVDHLHVICIDLRKLEARPRLVLTGGIVAYEIRMVERNVCQDRLSDVGVSGTREIEVDLHALPVLHPDGFREWKRIGQAFVPDFDLAVWSAVPKNSLLLSLGRLWCVQRCLWFVVYSEQSVYRRREMEFGYIVVIPNQIRAGVYCILVLTLHCPHHGPDTSVQFHIITRILGRKLLEKLDVYVTDAVDVQSRRVVVSLCSKIADGLAEKIVVVVPLHNVVSSY
jgi:hypothetical protein